MHLERDLTTPGLEDRPCHADDIAHVEVGEAREIFISKDVAVGHELNSATAVLKVGEDEPSLKALHHQPSRQRHRIGALGVSQQRLRRLGRVGWLESPRIGVDARRAKPLQLLAAIAHDSRQIELFLFRHDRKRVAARR